MDERVLVWAPARDGRLTCGFLTEGGFSCVNCESWEEFRAELEQGVGAVLIAGEYLTESVLPNLQALLESQPAWSDLPVIIVVGTEPLIDDDRFGRLGNVSLVQRPVSVDTLRSTVRAKSSKPRLTQAMTSTRPETAARSRTPGRTSADTCCGSGSVEVLP